MNSYDASVHLLPLFIRALTHSLAENASWQMHAYTTTTTTTIVIIIIIINVCATYCVNVTRKIPSKLYDDSIAIVTMESLLLQIIKSIPFMWIANAKQNIFFFLSVLRFAFIIFPSNSTELMSQRVFCCHKIHGRDWEIASEWLGRERYTVWFWSVPSIAECANSQIYHSIALSPWRNWTINHSKHVPCLMFKHISWMFYFRFGATLHISDA